MVEPLAVGVHGATKAQVQPGDLAVVIGAGPIGLVTALAALAAGCARVIISDIDDAKLQLAEKLGPVTSVNVRSRKLVEVVNGQTNEWGADVVFECSGSEKAASEVFDLVCPGGRVVFIGMPLSPIPYDVTRAAVKEARVEHVFRYAHVFPRCIAMLSSGKIDVSPLITRTFGFDDSVAAFEYAAHPPPGSVKVQIEMPA
jgi:D-xylulose reductase